MGDAARFRVAAILLVLFHGILAAEPELNPPRPRYGRGKAITTRGDDADPLEAVVMQQADTIQQMQAQLTALTAHLTSVQARLAQQETQVAFNVRLTANTPFAGHAVLVFDQVDLNAGSGYDHVTGVFTAPLSGLYEFSLKITHTPPGTLHVELLAGDEQIAEVEAAGDDRDRSSVTVAIRLTKGDHVLTRRMDGSATEAQGQFRSSFTGVLIRPVLP